MSQKDGHCRFTPAKTENSTRNFLTDNISVVLCRRLVLQIFIIYRRITRYGGQNGVTSVSRGIYRAVMIARDRDDVPEYRNLSTGLTSTVSYI